MSENIVLAKSFKFAVLVVDFYKDLKHQKEYILGSQFLRSGTSVGANIEDEEILCEDCYDQEHRKICPQH